MNKIIICGKAASGKDHLRRRLQAKGFRYGIPHTTRPPRSGEQDGVDYLFITVDLFNTLVLEGLLYEHSEFNDWHYGISKDEFSAANLFVMTPHAISKIRPADRRQCTIIYLDIPQEVRRQRLLAREMPGDTLERRLQADEVDFIQFEDYDIKITNPDF